MQTIYKWRAHAGVSIPAQVAGEELERIRIANNGRLAQEDVVANAKSKASPLHAAFEWNDKAAAHQHRLSQAGYLIRKLDVVQVAADNDEGKPIRAFVNVTRDEDRSFTSIAHAMSDDELREQVLARARKELEDWRQRYNDLVEFSAVFAAIEQMDEAA
jgi:hypothetical protein